VNFAKKKIRDKNTMRAAEKTRCFCLKKTGYYQGKHFLLLIIIRVNNRE